MAKKALPTLSLDFRFADERVTSAAYGAPITLLDFEVAIWNPAELLRSYRGYGTSTYQGRVALNDDNSFAILRHVRRRQAEMKQFLELGKTLVIFQPAPLTWFVATGKEEHSGTGRNRQTTRIVTEMSLAHAFPFKLSLVEAAGTSMRLVAGDPFASFWREYKEWFAYSSYQSDTVGEAGVVIDGTTHAVASIARVGKGTVILLPRVELDEAPGHYDYDEDEESGEQAKSHREWLERRAAAESEFLDDLFELVRAVRISTGDFSMPEWADGLRLAGEDDAEERLAKAQERVRALLEKADAEKVKLEQLRRRKILFTGTGTPFETLVEEAFTALGCDVEEGRPGRTDRIIRHGKDVMVAEGKGKGKSAAEADAAQLEKWVSEHQLEHGVTPKGVLVINAWRGKGLDERPKAFPDQMRPYSEKRDHCLITGLQLLGAWLDAEANPKRKREIFESIRDCVGVYPHYTDWREFLGVVEELPSAEAE